MIIPAPTGLGLLLAFQAVAAQPGLYLHAPKDGPSMKLTPWPPRARVLLYLSFDEGRGQAAENPGPWGDAVFGSSPRAEPSDPQWASGLRDGAVRFDGKDDYLTVPGVKQAQLGAFTFEAWVKPTGTSREMILDYGGTSWGFAFSKAWHGAYVVVGHKPKGRRIDTRQLAVSLGRWNHVAATFDGRTPRSTSTVGSRRGDTSRRPWAEVGRVGPSSSASCGPTTTT